MKSAIGDGMTRKDHADVSNQLVRDRESGAVIELIFKIFSMQIMRLVKMSKR